MAHYGGNPLALKLVAATTQELFSGRIAEVLNYVQQGLSVFDDIRDLLQQQLDRLSEIEKISSCGIFLETEYTWKARVTIQVGFAIFATNAYVAAMC